MQRGILWKNRPGSGQFEVGVEREEEERARETDCESNFRNESCKNVKCIGIQLHIGYHDRIHW